jgi:hypothetical protein
MLRFTLRATLSDGFTVNLPGSHAEQWQAERAAANYIRDYSDPCGLGVTCSQVAIIDREAVR